MDHVMSNNYRTETRSETTNPQAGTDVEGFAVDIVTHDGHPAAFLWFRDNPGPVIVTDVSVAVEAAARMGGIAWALARAAAAAAGLRTFEVGDPGRVGSGLIVQDFRYGQPYKLTAMREGRRQVGESWAGEDDEWSFTVLCRGRSVVPDPENPARSLWVEVADAN